MSDLQRQIGEAAVTLGGFDHVSWNGRIEEIGRLSPVPRVLGTAEWDGTLRYRKKGVIEPIQHLRTHWGKPQPPAILRAYKEAITTMVHETYHLVAPAGHEHQEGRAVFEDPSSRMLEEGVTELYTHQRLDDIIQAVGLDKGAPGINDIRLRMAYPGFVPGTRKLLGWVASTTDLAYDDLIEGLAGQTAAGKYPYLMEGLLTNTGLTPAIPIVQRPTCRRELENACRAVLDEAGFWVAGLSYSAYEALSQDLGHRAADALRNVLLDIKGQYGSTSQHIDHWLLRPMAKRRGRSSAQPDKGIGLDTMGAGR
jgi:hypothetical protein